MNHDLYGNKYAKILDGIAAEFGKENVDMKNKRTGFQTYLTEPVSPQRAKKVSEAIIPTGEIE